MEYGLIGEHLPHSFSKEIHRRCAGYEYVLRELTPEQVPGFLEKKEFKAINVTIPYKRTVIPYLSEIDAAAREIGAVNTVVNRNGALWGYNTDFYGMQALLRHAGISLKDRKVLILGTGGTCRTARAVAKAEGAREIVTAGRAPGPENVTYEELYRLHSDGEIIVNTTPCGMFPYADGTEDRPGTPVELSRFPSLCGVVDAVYNPLRTNLILDARARGIPAEGGLYMLVAQGVLASRIFLGQETNSASVVPQIDSVYASLVREKENIVLIGMPGCGKTTVGKLLAGLLDRPFVDTDAEIVRSAGKEIPEIFAESGEPGFRDLEEKTLREIANTSSGSIIATGGGAILRQANLRALRRTGRLYFLNRPLEALIPTADRPLSSNSEDLRRRFEERYPLYCAACDRAIPADGTAEDVAQAIRKDFEL